MVRLPWRRSPRPAAGWDGGARGPGSMAYAHLEGNVVHRIPALEGQVIRRGDIVTQSGDRLARVTSAACSGDGMNWGDVSAGAYVALADAGAPGGAGSSVPVYTYGAMVEVVLDEGIAPGARVGVDLRDCEGGRRADRGAPVDMSTPRDSGGTLWRRVRAMSPADVADPVRGRALLGTVAQVLSGSGARLASSRVGDIGAVVIEAQA